jgi:hypothetical protein
MFESDLRTLIVKTDSSASGWSPNDLWKFELDPQPLLEAWWPSVVESAASGWSILTSVWLNQTQDPVFSLMASSWLAQTPVHLVGACLAFANHIRFRSPWLNWDVVTSGCLNQPMVGWIWIRGILEQEASGWSRRPLVGAGGLWLVELVVNVRCPLSYDLVLGMYNQRTVNFSSPLLRVAVRPVNYFFIKDTYYVSCSWIF